jgi:hypothetical protein
MPQVEVKTFYLEMLSPVADLVLVEELPRKGDEMARVIGIGGVF